MAVYRQVQCSFWEDDEVYDLFTPEDKLFLLYLLTNPHTKQCGIYRITAKQISHEIGYAVEAIKVLIDRMKTLKKIAYNEQTREICIFNWPRYNYINSPAVINCIKEEFEQIKDKNLIKLLIISKKTKIILGLEDAEIDGGGTVGGRSIDGHGTVVVRWGEEEKRREEEEKRKEEKKKRKEEEEKRREENVCLNVCLPAEADEKKPSFEEIWSLNYQPKRQKNPTLYSRLFDTFYYYYEEIYPGGMMMIRQSKNVGILKKLAEQIKNHYDSLEKQLYTTSFKLNILMAIAVAKNKYQNWKFTPLELSRRWDELVDGCIVIEKGKQNKAGQIEYAKQINETYERLKKEKVI